jgi:septum site-determining protein MinC
MARQTDATDEQIAIKGTRDGVSVTIGQGPWPELMARLAGRLEATRDFFKGARVLMDVGARTVSAAELQQAAQVLAGHGMSLVSVISTNAETQEAGRQAGLGLVLPQPAHADNQVRTLPFVEGILLRRTLRSGQVARHEGHVAIL